MIVFLLSRIALYKYVMLCYTWSLWSLHLLSREYLKNGLMNSIQIWHVVITCFEGVPYFKVTLTSHI